MKLNLCAILFAIGTYLVWFLPSLLPLNGLLLSLPLALSALALRKLLPLAFFLLGLSWGIYQCHQTASSQIYASSQSFDAQITGVVSDLPQDRGISQRFEFRVDSYTPITDSAAIEEPRKLLLSWYNYQNQLVVGDKLNIEVRLRRPRGLSNFGQFDYRRWLLGNGVDATGYVRSGEKFGVSYFWMDQINLLRVRGFARIQEQDLEHPELISALGLGVQSEIEQSQWDLFIQTGVIHLMVISGLHIGFAGLMGFYFGGFLCKPFLGAGVLQQDILIRALFTLIFAALYASLAGLSLPAFRALVMLLILVVSRAFKLHWSGWTILSLALAVIAALQPSAVLQDSFWMSFGAVLVLVVSLSGRPNQSGLTAMVRAQVMLLGGFGGLLLCLGKPIYLAGFVANLLAVPFAGLVLVPVILIAMLLLPFLPEFSAVLLKIADSGLGLLLEFLRQLSRIPIPVVEASSWSFTTGLLICITSVLLISVPSTYLRTGLAAILLPLFAGVKTDKPEFSILFFDVGQGTAVLIEQPGYRLLYDTGPAFSAGFNAGADILLPHFSDRSRLDTLVVSHDDSDHSGGLDPVLGTLDVAELYVGGSEIIGMQAATRPKYCSAGQYWQVGQVEYRFLHPPESDRQAFNLGTKDNNQSCVLLIEFMGQSLLIAGDIEGRIEAQIMQKYPDLTDIDLVLVPHHGSKTSSSTKFVTQLNPGIAVVSAGYGNSFGHPAEEVIERYSQVGAQIYSTAELGAVLFEWPTLESQVLVTANRDNYKFWWQE